MTAPDAVPYQIEIHNSQSLLPIDESHLMDVVRRTLADEEVVAADVSVAVVDNETIHELNRRYLAHDYETDVLSFLLDGDGPEAQSLEPFTKRGRGKRIDGEVIVSAEAAAEMAADFSWRPQDELVLYLVHGLLHLVGYDDLTDAEREVMRRREREVLRFWDLVPAGRAASPANGPTPERRGLVR